MAEETPGDVPPAAGGRAAGDDPASGDGAPREGRVVVIDGPADADGRLIAVRIPGDMIAGENGAIVGRSPFESSVVLDHPEVSRRHFRLLVQEGSIMIEDLDTTNGTRLDDVPLTPGESVPLPRSGTLEVGGLRLTATVQD